MKWVDWRTREVLIWGLERVLVVLRTRLCHRFVPVWRHFCKGSSGLVERPRKKVWDVVPDQVMEGVDGVRRSATACGRRLQTHGLKPPQPSAHVADFVVDDDSHGGC